MTFEEKMNRLDEITRKLEGNKMPLAETANLYEEGLKLTLSCRAELEATDEKIQAGAQVIYLEQ